MIDPIILNSWNHVAAVLKGTTGYIYINGVLSSSGTLNRPDNVNRVKNNIGADTWGDAVLNGTYDEIKIYNTALSVANINLDMSIGANNSMSLLLFIFERFFLITCFCFFHKMVT